MAITITLDKRGGAFEISCHYLDADVVRRLPSRRWQSKTKTWRAPVNYGNAKMLFEYVQQGIAQADDRALARIAQEGKAKPEVKRVPFPAGFAFKRAPFPHQRAALDYIYGLDAAALFCEMGLGKTKIALDYMQANHLDDEIDALLVLCPMSVKENWANEVRMNTQAKPLLHDPGESKAFRAAFVRGPADVFICATESIQQRGRAFKYCEEFIKGKRFGMIIDESHMIKNPSANRTKNAVALGENARKKLILTGTPIAHNPLDLFGQFNFLNPDIIEIYDFYSFKAKHAIMGGYENKQIVGFRHVPELMSKLRPHSVIQLKKDHLDLPPKLYSQRVVDLTKDQRAKYEEAKERVLTHGTDTRELQNVLVEMIALQQAVSGFYMMDDRLHRIAGKNPKIEELKAIRAENPSKRMIIWGKFQHEIVLIKEAFPEAYTYYGAMTPAECSEQLAAFEKSENGIFAATLQKGGIGLNMAFCDLVVFFSNTFRYIDRAQAEDRCHRIGQKNRVLYVDLLAKNTVDRIIAKAINDKAEISEYVFDALKERKLKMIL